MLVDSNNNDDYGVMVDKISPTKVIVFRLDKNTYPVFSQSNTKSTYCKIW